MADELDPHAGKKAQTQTGKRAMRAVFETARRQIAEEASPDDPDPNLARNGIKPGQWDGFPHNGLPPNCPVQPVGSDVNGNYYFISARGLLRVVERWDMTTLIDLFAPYVNYLYWAWPGWSKPKVDKETGELVEPPRVVRVEKEKAQAALMNAASRRPLFDPSRQHRGRGGWADRNGAFIWHSGGYLWRSEKGRLSHARPAEHDGFLYTRQADTIEPWDTAVTAEESPARRFLNDFRTWNWERPYLDPVLALGWMATSLMGAALKARPVIFTTGGAGVGKTTLREVFRKVLEGAVFSVADTTAAGIYQQMRNDALMVLVDELENKAGSSKAQAIIDLARIAYSGDDMARGGQDHEGVRFKMYASFMFSAINLPAMTDADRSRMAILNLQRLDAMNGIGSGVLVKEGVDGRMLLRQVMDGWDDFNRRILPNWWDALKQHGFDSRDLDTYVTLLAAAELLVGPEALEDCGLPVTDPARLGEMIAEATRPARAERLDNWHKCLNHLMDSTISAWRDGVQPTVGGVMDRMTWPLSGDGLELRHGQERLQLVNLTARGKNDPATGFCLAIPKDGPQLKRLFDGTDWASSGWWYALKQAPAHIVLRDREKRQHNMKINGKTVWCLLVDMEAFAEYVDKLG